MNQPDLLSDYPMRRIQAVDGTAVTARLWEEAHAYHRTEMRLHRHYSHGAGIVEGLEVVAAEPADATVYIRPGVAVDDLGHRIVVPEPMTYHLGKVEGRLRLVLSYVESQAERDASQEDGPLYVHAQYSLDAVQGQQQKDPCVELARFERHGEGAALRNAVDPQMPGINEIDLRFRSESEDDSNAATLVGSYSLSGGDDTLCTAGARELARGLRSLNHTVWADRVPQLDAQLDRYDMIILMARKAFTLSADDMSALYRYLQAGGMMLVLVSSDESDDETSSAEASVSVLLDSLAVELAPLTEEDTLLKEPYLFYAPPKAPDGITMGGGVVRTTAPWLELWSAQSVDGARPPRHEIRSAHEFGANLLAAAMRRRMSKGDKTE